MTNMPAINSRISGSNPFEKVYLAEREIEEDGPETFAKTLKFVHDLQNDEIQVELWGADHFESNILGSKIWFEYYCTPTRYQDLPVYIRKKMSSIIEGAELSFSRSAHGEISSVFVRIE